MEVGLNEAGLVLGKIHQASSHCEYKGDKQLTEKKIIRNVFKVRVKHYFKLLFCFNGRGGVEV